MASLPKAGKTELKRYDDLPLAELQQREAELREQIAKTPKSFGSKLLIFAQAFLGGFITGAIGAAVGALLGGGWKLKRLGISMSGLFRENIAEATSPRSGRSRLLPDLDLERPENDKLDALSQSDQRGILRNMAGGAIIFGLVSGVSAAIGVGRSSARKVNRENDRQRNSELQYVRMLIEEKSGGIEGRVHDLIDRGSRLHPQAVAASREAESAAQHGV